MAKFRSFTVALIASLSACGGGGGSDAPPAPTLPQPVVTVLAPEIVFTTPNEDTSKLITFDQTGKRPSDRTLVLQFDLVFDNYFKCVTNGHAGIMMHASLEQLASAQYRGVGLIYGQFGNSTYTTRLLPNLSPLAIIETWASGAVSESFDALLAPTISPTLQDGVRYSVVVTSVQGADGKNLIGYTIQGGLVNYSSGMVVDVNPVVDMSRQSFVFYNVGYAGDIVCPYAVRWIAPTVTWKS